jgi:hypothetical protein
VSPFRKPTWTPFPPTSGRSATKPRDSWDRSIGKAGRFQPEKFEDQYYEAALVDLINKKRAGQPITKKDRLAGGNVVVDLMEALRRSVGGAELAKASKVSKKPRRVASGQMEMLMPIRGQEGKGDAGEEVGAQAAAEVGLEIPRGGAGPSFFQQGFA